jgi:hypothetical protein
MLTIEQLATLATVATVVVWFLTVVYVGILKLPKPSANVLKTVVFAGSTVLAYFWSAVVLPAFPAFGGDLFVFAFGLLDWAVQLLTVAVLVFKTAQLIYDFLWSRLLTWLQEKVFAGRLTLMPR